MHNRLLVVTLVAFVACSNPAAPGGGGGPGVSYYGVGVADSLYNPDSVTIAAGGGVKWTNAGPSTHTVTADTGSAFNATIGPPGMDPYGYPTAGQAFSRVFATAGTYRYHCNFHANMHGVIVVTP
jgi:plastocyanin